MSPIRVEPTSPGCCLLSLLLLPFNILFLPIRFIVSPDRRRRYYGDPDRHRWM